MLGGFNLDISSFPGLLDCAAPELIISYNKDETVGTSSLRLFCDALLDDNPLHLDDDYMKGDFGKTNFGGIIMHGMNNFGLISRMITDWAYPLGAAHCRIETRWVKPVPPGDTVAKKRPETALPD
jgi:acyl dehydratase